MTQHCPSCGSELTPDANFCNRCGQAIAAMPQEEAPSPGAPSGQRRRTSANALWTGVIVVSLILAVSMIGVGAWLALAGSGEEEERTPTARTGTSSGAVYATGTPRVTASPGALLTPTTRSAVTVEAAGASLKIGLLLDYTGVLAEFGPAGETGAQLAVGQINAAGGVLGRPVQIVVGDSGTNLQVAVEAANRLVNVEEVQAIVGSLASGITIAVADGVAVPNQILMISPASASPALTDWKDDDFVFRTTPSDAVQGIVLADWAIQQGFRNAATLYVNNAYGKGLSDQFVESFQENGGTITAAVSHEPQQTSYMSELQEAVAADPDVLVAISYPSEGEVYLREAVQNKLIDKFLFVDGTKSQDIIDGVGATALEGTTGTSPHSPEKAELTTNFDAEYSAEYGKDVPALSYIRESYDAVVLIALAAEAAKSTDPVNIRDQLRRVAGPPGTKFGAGAEGITQALEAVRAGADIDFEGSANSDNFNENGDVLTGAIEIFRITGGRFEVVKTVPFSLQ